MQGRVVSTKGSFTGNWASWGRRKMGKQVMSRFQGVSQVILAVVVLAVLGVAAPEAAAVITDVDITTGRTMWQGGVFVLDVRTTAEVLLGYIPGAYNIDVGELAGRLDEIDDLKNVDILVYCKAGGRSAAASVILDANGFTKVYNMLGGFDAWSLAGYETQDASAGYDEIGLEVGYRLWESGVFYLDVRSPSQYEAGHITDAYHIPLEELATRLTELDAYLDEDIVVYCSSGGCSRSPQACAILATTGFTLVHDLVDGYEDWAAAGYPTEGTGCLFPPFCCSAASVAVPRSGGPDGGLLLLAVAAFAAVVVPRMKARQAA
jgi:rhodanese-related sulfurtransferase